MKTILILVVFFSLPLAVNASEFKWTCYCVLGDSGNSDGLACVDSTDQKMAVFLFDKKTYDCSQIEEGLSADDILKEALSYGYTVTDNGALYISSHGTDICKFSYDKQNKKAIIQILNGGRYGSLITGVNWTKGTYKTFNK